MTRLSILAASLLLGASAAAQPTLVPLVSNGPTGERINLVIVAEGYTEAQRSAFTQDASAVAGAFFSAEPYDRYSQFFNVFALFVASPESGADHPSRNEYRDTAFGAFYDCGGTQRLICLSGAGQIALYARVRELLPEYDQVLALVNDPEYGGAGGSYSTASVHPLSAEIAIHEVGHSFARLSDEYGGTGSGFTSVNTTTTTARSAIPWRVWIEPTTPLPTPSSGAFQNAVGLFEGAAYADLGAYRPQHMCKMRSLGVPFCAVCREHHIGAIYNLVSPIAAVEPAGSTVESQGGQTLTFRVEALVPSDRRAFEWTVGGVPVDAQDVLELQSDDLPAGTTQVGVRVADVTDEVREPSLRPLLQDTHSWTVTRLAVAGEAPVGPVTRLGAVAPNPVRGSARVRYQLARAAHVRLTVLDVLGRVVTVVEDGPQPAGPHQALWPTDGVPAGLYLVRLDAAGTVETRPVTVVR